MALSDLDRAYICEVAQNTSAEISRQIIADVLQWHISSCPHGKNLLAAKWAIIGACTFSAICSGATVATLIKVFGA